MKIHFVLSLLAAAIEFGYGANILFGFGMSSKSMEITYMPLVTEV